MKSKEEGNIPEQHITPESFVLNAWDMDFRISTADVSVLDPSFVEITTSLAGQRGISVYYLDFSKYETAEMALFATENAEFLDAIENGNKKALLWFMHCDSLAPLNINVTYSLRTVLTTRSTNNIQSVFVASKRSILEMFANREAPFYQSHFRLTGYSREVLKG